MNSLWRNTIATFPRDFGDLMTNRRLFLTQVGAIGLSASFARRTIAASRPAPIRKARVVQTVLGPITDDRMGFTAGHEHILASSTGFMRLWPEFFGNRSQFISGVVERMKAAKAAGIDTIVDCTTADLGRDVRLLQEVSRRSDVHIIAATCHWLTPTPSFEARTADELTNFFALEIERGMEDTGIKPGVIKAASQGEAMTPFQENVFRAAARASKRTGVPVTTHSDARHRGGEQQAAIFEQEGLEPKMVCIGHSDESADFDYLAGLARRGYTLGFDHLFYGLPSMGAGTDGIPTWQDRATMLRRLIDAGFNDRVLLASDWFFALTIAPTGTNDVLKERNPSGNLFNVRNTLPYLREMGVTDEQLRAITVINPKAFFARA
jgi:phosphotriesterase-related protein